MGNKNAGLTHLISPLLTDPTLVAHRKLDSFHNNGYEVKLSI